MKTNMKLLLVPMMVLLSFFESFSQETKQIVKVTNLEAVEGTLYVGWYNEPSDFRINDKAIYREKIEVSNQSEVTIQFSDIPVGDYAIAVFLDENDNYKLDRNLFGIPTEKYGFSNNILPALRPATFEESAFRVSQQEEVVAINLKDQ